LKPSLTGSADTTKQQDYDALWRAAEDLVASVIMKERRTEIEAAQLVAEQVLDTIAPKRTAARPGPAQPSPWAKPRPDK
jgi:4'-phosphopantetheinyl transferase EntD